MAASCILATVSIRNLIANTAIKLLLFKFILELFSFAFLTTGANSILSLASLSVVSLQPTTIKPILVSFTAVTVEWETLFAFSERRLLGRAS